MNLEKARKQTPGCENVLHFNNAGASLLSQPVLDAQAEHLQLEILRGGYEAKDLHEDKTQAFYSSAAKLIDATADEIAFIESATRAWDMCFYSLPLQKGDIILTSEAEYASNYIAFLHAAQTKGVSIEVVPSDETGQISLEHLERMIGRARVLSLTHIPAQGGLVNPAEEVGRIARQHEVFYLLDATQSIGQMPVDVQKIGCDALCATGRKYLRGPRGTGFLYVRKEKLHAMNPPFLDMYAARWTDLNAYEVQQSARRFETWERNVSNLIGLGKAIDYAMEWGLEAIWERVSFLGRRLREELRKVDGVQVRDLGRVQCGIVTFTLEGMGASDVKRKLGEQGINVGVSKGENALLDLKKRGLEGVVRASLHYYNSEEEIMRFVEVLSSLSCPSCR